jgi:CNT family concentrative nucleoside transporter
MAEGSKRSRKSKRSKAGASAATKAEAGSSAGSAPSAPTSPKDPRAWEPFAVAGAVLALLAVNSILGTLGGGWAARLASVVGIAFLLGLAFLMSSDRHRVEPRTVVVGLGLQFAIAFLALLTPIGTAVFKGAGRFFEMIFAVSGRGAAFVFGPVATKFPDSFDSKSPYVLAVTLVSVIVFMGALTRVLYHLGVLQRIVRAMAWVMRRMLRTSGAESLSAGANVFVGMVEAPLTIRPYVAGLTRSELFCVMTVGMATVAGTVLAVYANFLQGVFGDAAAGHLLTASVMSAPAAIVVAKIMVPETGEPATLDADVMPAIDEGDEKPVNVMDAAARGGLEGMRLAISVVGLLIAFVALVYMANGILGAVSGGRVTFDKLAGWLFSPIAIGMGIPIKDCVEAGGLMGTKTVLNELLAYEALAEGAGALTPHTTRVMSYALCGFANFGSVAIMIAGIGGIAPKRRADLARLGLLSIVSGTLAAFMTGCWAGLMGGWKALG